MSWDVLFQDLPNNIQSFDQIPRDFKPQNLCSDPTAKSPHPK